MSDTDYIPDAERDDTEWDQIERSHAVADSVARELAAALRELCNGVLTCEESAHPCLAYSKQLLYNKHPALARFDATIGQGTNQ